MISSLFRVLPNIVTQNLTASYFKFQAWRTVGNGIHSQVQILKFKKMDVQILPALQDNYMYLIIDNETNDAAIVDPVDPDSVLEAVKAAKVNLIKVLTTHHHWDHAGGNEKLVSKFNGGTLEVIGGDDRIGGLTKMVHHNDTFSIGNLNVRCLFTPCHTTGHICYEVTSNTEKAVFTGDTLFSGGCGRFFEGTPAQMYRALIDVLSELPDETKVFCGHEYTLQNLAYAKHVEPDNEDILKTIAWAQSQREQNIPTIPSTIGREKLINPFMRVNEQAVQRHAGSYEGVETMGFIRREKDSFKPKP